MGNKSSLVIDLRLSKTFDEVATELVGKGLVDKFKFRLRCVETKISVPFLSVIRPFKVILGDGKEVSLGTTSELALLPTGWAALQMSLKHEGKTFKLDHAPELP